MDIGKKVKKARISKAMTQSELAGDKITRNMLSQIENGSAMPSVATITYIAEKLGIPTGYFLCESKNDFFYRKMLCIDSVKKAYFNGEYQKCVEICKDSLSEYDDEICMILCECHFRLGRDFFKKGHLKSSHKELNAALHYAGKTVYNVNWVRIASSVHLEFIGELLPSLRFEPQDSYTFDIDALVFTDMYKYMRANTLIEKGKDIDKDIDNIENLCLWDFENLALARHIEARLKMKNKDYGGAIELMRVTAEDEKFKEYGSALLCVLYSDMEICFRETKDFEHAYEYATKKSELIPEMEK